jgi:SAM-dependent methyltransferase
VTEPTRRFSSRVADYVKYRPTYPAEAIDAIVRVTGVPRGATIADVGAGTGISARPLLERGFRVIAVEPNDAMRAAADADLGSFPGYQSVAGTAERTGLPDASVALAIAAQAFHWFEKGEARAELHRVVAPPHWVALMWNERLVDTPFLRDYEAALRAHAIDYDKVDHRNVDREAIAAFFGGSFDTLTFPNVQRFDRAGLIGRALSSSYVPQAGHPKHEAMMAALAQAWGAHARDGVVEFRYLTSVHVGTLQSDREAS